MKALEVQQVSALAGDFRLGPVTLPVEAGEYLVLMGPTGSGKSLLVKAICGLLRVEAGQILVCGREVTDLPPRERGIGYVPQTSALFPHLSVAGNVTFAAWARGMDPADALAAAGDITSALGIGPLLERWPVTLSGGERQKVALARALCAGPRLLVLDEPVSALDEPSRRDVCALLREIHRRFGLTTLHICHSLDEARAVSTRVAILDAGRVACSGPLPGILATPPDHPAARRLLGLT